MKGCTWYRGTGNFTNSTSTGTNATAPTDQSVCLPEDISDTQAAASCAIHTSEAACASPCKWTSINDIVVPSHVCVPNDLSDQALATQCMANKDTASCAQPCFWIDPTRIAELADPSRAMCRPSTTENMTKLDQITKCAKMDTDVVCDANADCRWGTLTSAADPNYNCLPKNIGDL